MYSGELKRGRFRVPCILACNKNNLQVLDLLFDTGAVVTCVLESYLTDIKDLIEKVEGDTRVAYGIYNDRNAVIRLQAYKIPQVYVGDVHIGEQKIYVTNDEHLQVNIVGMDLIKQVDTRIHGNYITIDAVKSPLQLFEEMSSEIRRKYERG